MIGSINPVRNSETLSTFFQPMNLHWPSSIISNGVKELGKEKNKIEKKSEKL
jgi:hypothetical protein